MLKALSNDTQSQDLGPRHCLFWAAPIGEDARQLGHFGQPTPIFLLLSLNAEIHGLFTEFVVTASFYSRLVVR
jgi:hypothetical protein